MQSQETFKNHSQFDRAVAAIDEGDLNQLKHLISRYPELITARSITIEEPYAGYFYGATLLHHIAGNPIRNERLPKNIVEITRYLLEAGAKVDAGCGGGPTQPETAGGTTLGLVVSGSQPHELGVAEELIDLLLEHGASMDQKGDGGLFWISIYHTVESKGQKNVARLLFEKGHPVDMVFAAGLGLLRIMKSYLEEGGSLKSGADRFFKHHRREKKAATKQEILEDCLVAASICNEPDVINFLLDHGVNINCWRRWGPWLVTPLHGACWAGWLDSSQLLLERGADPHLIDPEHNSTPVGWAHYCGRTELFEWLNEHDEFFSLFDALEFGKTERFKQLFADQDANMAIGEGAPGVLLRIAAYHGDADLIEFLLDKGADKSLKNPDGKSPYDIAKEQGHDSVLVLLQ